MNAPHRYKEEIFESRMAFLASKGLKPEFVDRFTTIFRGMDLRGYYLGATDFCCVEFIDCDLRGTSFRHSKFKAAVFQECHTDETTDLSYCTFGCGDRYKRYGWLRCSFDADSCPRFHNTVINADPKQTYVAISADVSQVVGMRMDGATRINRFDITCGFEYPEVTLQLNLDARNWRKDELEVVDQQVRPTKNVFCENDKLMFTECVILSGPRRGETLSVGRKEEYCNLTINSTFIGTRDKGATK